MAIDPDRERIYTTLVRLYRQYGDLEGWGDPYAEVVVVQSGASDFVESVGVYFGVASGRE